MKRENTFKFIGFHERINSIHIDSIVRYNSNAASLPSYADTHFYETLEKWTDLNGTFHFDAFKKSIPRADLQTYAQVLHHQKAIVAALKTHLLVKDTLCLAALIDLTIALCRDLQADFYAYFWDFFDTLLKILAQAKLENVELLEQGFTCFAYLFKYCWRRLILELDTVFGRFLPLISHKRAYIRRFSSEASAFLIRKCQNFDTFLDVCFDSIKAETATLESIVGLLCQAMQSVQKSLHSKASEVYDALLKKLLSNFQDNLETSVVISVTETLISHIAKANMDPLMDNFSSFCSKQCENDIVLPKCLKLGSIWVKSPNGKRVFELFASKIGPAIAQKKFFNHADVGALFFAILLEISSRTFQRNDSSELKLSIIDLFDEIVKINIKNAKFDHGIIDFLRKVVNACPAIFHEFSKSIVLFCDGQMNLSILHDNLERKIDIMDFYCNLLKNHLVSKLALQQHFSECKNNHILLMLVLNEKDKIESMSTKELAMALYIWPYTPHFNLELLINLMEVMFKQNYDQWTLEYRLSILFGIQSMNLKNVELNKLKSLDLLRFLEFLKKNPSDIITLNILNSVMEFYPKLLLDNFSSNEALELLMDNVLSGSGHVRKTTLEILDRFPWPKLSSDRTIFKIGYECENIPLTLKSYREKIVLYKKLGAAEYEQYLPEVTPIFRSLVVKMLLGQFNVNFTLLFPTIRQVLESQARCQPKQEFWDTYSNILKYLGYKITDEKNELDILYDNLPFLQETIDSFKLEDRLMTKLQLRMLAWQSMEDFADLAESKTRFFSEMILNLTEKEVCLESKNDQTENFLLDQSSSESRSANDKESQAMLFKTLISCLTIYAKFVDIKNVAKEKQMKELYFKLLMSNRPNLQKVALECLLAYKNKHIELYSDNLRGLLDDKQFKDQLILFNVDSESSVLDPQHRSDVMPIVLRLLYGRLSGKGGDARQRKEQIYRFLAGCQNEELKTFLGYLFQPLDGFIEKDGSNLFICQDILKTYDFSCSVPLRKLNGILTHLSSIVQKLSFSLGDENSIVLRVVFILAAIFLKMRNSIDTLQPRFGKLWKKLRNEILCRFFQFCSHVDEYKFESNDVQCMFDFGIRSFFEEAEAGSTLLPLDLIKLCEIWSENTRFYPLLATLNPAYSQQPLLAIVLSMLNNENMKLSSNLLLKLSTILFNLVSLADLDTDKDSVPIPDTFSTILYNDSEKTGLLNFGTRIILPHANTLLSFFMKSCEKIERKRQPVCCTEKWTKVLTVLAESARNLAQPEKLLATLLVLLKTRYIKNPVIETDLIKSVDCLLQKTTDQSVFLRDIAYLMGTVENRQSRDALVTLIKNLTLLDPSLSDLRDIIIRLNTWDEKRLDEPDFERRIKAYVDVQKILKSESTLQDAGCHLIFYNCLHFVTKIDDLALRDNAGYTLRLLINSLKEKLESPNAGRAFVTLHVVPSIKDHIKSKSEAVRHELLLLLAVCIRCYPEHPKFSGLVELMDINDVDLNFFDNITHIQLHRRTRAIRRLCEKLEAPQSDDASESVAAKVRCDSLFNFVWPVCYAFIFDPIYSNNSMLIEESVHFLAVFAKRTPWRRYEAMLKHYLQRMRKDVERQKVLVKIVVAIMDAFHFSCAQAESSAVGVSKTKENGISQAEKTKEENLMTTNQSIFQRISQTFIPELQNCLTKRTSTDIVHKSMQKYFYDEDEEVLRVPLALALVKLLQKLGRQILEANLSNVLMKICQMLKSRSFEIRETTRKVLCQIADSLSARYLPYVLKEMRASLTRGYQLHVLAFSMAALLDFTTSRDSLKPGDLDPCLEDVLQICNDDLFGETSEKKQVDEVTKKLKEAKSTTKCVSIFRIIGQLISSAKVDYVINFIKSMLDKKVTHKTINKTSDILHQFSMGLNSNPSFDWKFSLLLAHKIITDNIGEKNRHSEIKTEKTTSIHPESCLLIETAPPRCGILPKQTKSSGHHLFVGFGCEILELVVKKQNFNLEANKEKAQPQFLELCSMLDPFFGLLVQGLKANHTKVISGSVRCLIHFVKFPLPSFETMSDELVDQVFLLLARYAGLGSAAKGETQELLASLFKLITNLVRDVEFAKFEEKHVKILLTYVEEDLFDSRKQATAFGLLKAILQRKLECAEISDLMKKVEQLAIESPSDSVREQCRSLIEKFVRGYPLRRKMDRVVQFFCAQLHYQYESGRRAALDILDDMLSYADQKRLRHLMPLIFVNVSTLLVNDESAKMRRRSSQVLDHLFSVGDASFAENSIQMTFDWLKSENFVHKKLAGHLLALLVDKIDRNTVLKALEMVCCETRSIEAKTFDEDDMEDEEEENSEKQKQQQSLADQIFYLLLIFMEKVFSNEKHAPLLKLEENGDIVEKIWDLTMKSLKHCHLWVQYSSCRLVGTFLARYKAEEFERTETSSDYLIRNSKLLIKQLSMNFIEKMRQPGCTMDMAEQVTKNLVFILRCVRVMAPDKNGKSDSDETRTSFEWLTTQLCRICRFEVAKLPEQSIRRNSIIKLFASLVLECDEGLHFDKTLALLFPLLYRELTVDKTDEPLKTLCSEVVALVKNKIGMEKFGEFWATSQASMSRKKSERKRKLAEDAITDPEKAARRKVKQHQSRKDTKKRKRFQQSGKPFKKLKRNSAE